MDELKAEFNRLLALGSLHVQQDGKTLSLAAPPEAASPPAAGRLAPPEAGAAPEAGGRKAKRKRREEGVEEGDSNGQAAPVQKAEEPAPAAAEATVTTVEPKAKKAKKGGRAPTPSVSTGERRNGNVEAPPQAQPEKGA